ncbi:MAG: SGNH/GDSL hydrolase family protein [Ruminococcaceae bacterium]|nr:SGNH/GDSL hydrolase family protein [Oscillospiraceae bacterium]
MDLTFQQIRDIAFGAVRAVVLEDGIHFYKCTEKQIAAWQAQSDFLGDGSRCTTGVRLDFHTNSQSFGFTPATGGRFEIYVDGVLRRQLRAEAGKREEMVLCDALGNQNRSYRVTLVFPSHSHGVISALRLDDGATFVPHEHDMRLLFIGDSITQGWAASYDSFSYAWRTTRHFNADSVIQGIGGAYYHESTFDVPDFEPDAVILAYGTNDFSHYKSLVEMHGHVAAYLDLVREAWGKKQVFVITPIWRDKRDGKSMGSFEDCRALVASEAKKRGYTVIDGLSLVPPLAVFFEDEYLHPNNEGFSLYAENLVAVLEKHLKK